MAGSSSSTSTVSVWAGLSTSPIVTPVKGPMVPVSSTVCPATVPAIVGASFTEVVTTVVVPFTTGAATPSSTMMVKVVVSLSPGATRFSVGSKLRPRIAVVASAALPLKR